MKKFAKTILIISILVLSCFSLVACGKDKDEDDEGKKKLEELWGNIVGTETTEITTEEIITTEATTTEEITTTEATTTEATTEDVVEEKAPYNVTDSVDTTNIINSTVEGTDYNPAKQGEWCQALKSAGTSNPRQNLYFRITNVTRGDEAQTLINEYMANDGVFSFSELEYDDLEYCILTYQVYFPEDYLQNEWGIAFTGLDFHTVDGDNHGIIGNYIGMAQTYEITERVKNDTLFAGDVYEGKVVFVMQKGYTNYMMYHRYYDDDYNEYTRYIACEKLPDGSSEVNPSSSEATTTETAETQTGSSTCTIKNDVYYNVGVLYADGTYATKEQIEASAGEPFDVVFTVFDGKCIFDATGVGNEGAGRTAGDIVQTSETEFYFTDASGKTYNGTYIASENKITINMGESSIVFVAE